jgi:Leucine rich repeat N-terminal domain
MLLNLLACSAAQGCWCQCICHINTSMAPIIYTHPNITCYAALLSFKAALSDPNGSLSAWRAGTLPCGDSAAGQLAWPGVFCSTRGGQKRVYFLDLSQLGLKGSLANASESLVPLARLQALWMSDNDLSGMLPTALGLVRSTDMKAHAYTYRRYGRAHPLLLIHTHTHTRSKTLPSIVHNVFTPDQTFTYVDDTPEGHQARQQWIDGNAATRMGKPPKNAAH